MKILKILVIGVIGLVAGLIAIAYTFPAEYKVSREISINATPEQIYANLIDLRKWSEWTVWYQNDPQMTTEYTGVNGHVGSAMEWKSESQGSGKLTLTKIMPNQSLEYTLKFPEFNASTGRLILSQHDQATKVTWSDEGNLGNNPINRWFGLVLDGMIGPDFQKGLENLKVLAEKQASVAAAPLDEETIEEDHGEVDQDRPQGPAHN